MAINIEPMLNGLARQRRSIIVVSMLLWFLQYGQVEEKWGQNTVSANIVSVQILFKKT